MGRGGHLRQLYRLMLKIRVLDQKMINLQRQGRIAFHGLTTGEEAAVIALWHACGLTRPWNDPALSWSNQRRICKRHWS